MKKFLVLTLVAGFSIASAIGCSSSPTTSKAAEGNTKTETKVQKGPESKTTGETKSETTKTPETKTEVRTETKADTVKKDK